MFFKRFFIEKPYWRQLDLGIFAVLFCFLKSQIHFLHFRDFQMSFLYFFKLPESCEGLGRSILLTRIGHRVLWPRLPQWHLLSFFVTFFAFFPHFYGNFWQCPLYYAVQHNLGKKNLLNFQEGQMSGFLEQDWTFGWQCSSWQSRGKNSFVGKLLLKCIIRPVIVGEKSLHCIPSMK